MAFFGKKKHKDFDDDYILGNENETFFVNFDSAEQKGNAMSGAHKAPHAITVDEVLHSNIGAQKDQPANPTFTIPMANSVTGEYSAAAKHLMSKMLRNKQAAEEVIAEETAPRAEEPAKAEEQTEEAEPEEEPITAATDIAPEAPASRADSAKVDEIFARAQRNAVIKSSPQSAKTEFASPEFMEKLKGFLNDEGEHSTPAPAAAVENYTLASVDDILKSVEDKVRRKNLKAAMEKDVEINYTPAAEEEEVTNAVADKEETPAVKVETEAEPEPQVTIFAEDQAPIQIDVVHIDAADTDIESTRPVPLSYHFSFADEALPNADIETVVKEMEAEAEDEGATIQFDSLNNSDDISSISIDMTREMHINNFKLEPMDEDDGFDVDADSFEEEVFDDYECIDDASGFKIDLKKRCTVLLMRMIPTAILTVLMAVLSLPAFVGAAAENAVAFRIVHLVLFALTLIANLNTVLGVASLFKGRPDLDTPISIGAILSFVYACVCVMQPATVFLGAPVGLVLLAANLGKYASEKRIAKDFDRIATTDTKTAVKLIDESQGSNEIAKGAGLENVLVCGSQRTVNITGFFKKCYAANPYEKHIPAVLIAAGAVSILAGAISFVLTPAVVSAIGCALVVFTVFCPPTYCLISALPYVAAAKNVASSGGLICGMGGADNLSDVNAVVFNADQLFPAGTVNLYQMKILSPNPIDQAIVEAAAVATAAKSPLADMFNRIAQGRFDAVSAPVDSINLEGNMGISGWIKDRRILIGNRLLMETHGITIPSVTVDRNILEKGFFPVYVACAGVPCALFVVGYNVDRRIKYELQRLCNLGAVVLVNSTDPNISEEMISDYFGIWRESVRLMNANSLNVYKNAVNYKESFPASGIYNGSAEALACLVTSSARLKTAIKLMTAVNYVFVGLGALLCCYSIFTGALPSAVAVLALHAVNTLAGYFIPLIFKP